jgi:hypothetical protein
VVPLLAGSPGAGASVLSADVLHLVGQPVMLVDATIQRARSVGTV